MPDGLRGFVKEILRVKLHVDKSAHGMRLLFLGMQLRVSPMGVYFCLSDHRPRKVVALLQHYLSEGRQGRLSRSCNALLGRCGRAFLAPFLRRATTPGARLNAALRQALQWWCRWL